MPRKRVIVLALVFAFSGAFIGATLTAQAYLAFGPIPGPAGKQFQVSASPDGRWLVRNFFIDEDLALGRATIEPAGGGGVARTMYYGLSANFSWRHDDVVFTENTSRAEHVIDLQTGKFDYRTDSRLEFFGTTAIRSIPIVLVMVFDILWLRRWMRKSTSADEAMPQGS